MFYEPHDLNELLTPLPAEALGINYEHVDGNALCGSLFKDLQELLKSGRKDIVTLSFYLDECGLKELLDRGFEAFWKTHFPSGQTNISSVYDVYDTACALFDQREYDQAAGLFSLVIPLEDIRAHGLIALSACASRREFYKSGYDLAVASISRPAPHPRSFLLAGHCALRLNEMKTAKQYLAFASRVARKDAAYRPEQRASQSKLLSLQFA